MTDNKAVMWRLNIEIVWLFIEPAWRIFFLIILCFGDTDTCSGVTLRSLLKGFNPVPEEPWSSGQSGRLGSKRTWVRFQLSPNVFLLSSGIRMQELNGSRHDELHALAYPCRKIIIIIPSHAIQRQTSVSARYGSKKKLRLLNSEPQLGLFSFYGNQYSLSNGYFDYLYYLCSSGKFCSHCIHFYLDLWVTPLTPNHSSVTLNRIIITSKPLTVQQQKSSTFIVPDGFAALVAGWGYISQRPDVLPNELRVLAVQVVDLLRCKRLTPQGPGQEVLPYHYCAAVPGAFDSRPCRVSKLFQFHLKICMTPGCKISTITLPHLLSIL